MSRRILILSPFFFPEPISTGRYNTHLAEYLRDAGSAVTVACSHPVYPDWVVRRTDRDLPSVKAYRGGTLVRYPTSTLARRMVLELWFSWHAVRVVLAVRREVDWVVAVFPPSLFLSAAMALAPRGVRALGIVHDLQGSYAARLDSRVGRWIRAAVLYVERRAFRRCEQLVFLSEAMRERAILEYGLPAARCTVAYPSATVIDAPDTPVPAPLQATGVAHVVYSGALGTKQDPDGLVELMVQLAQLRTDVRCHIFSRGPVFDRLRMSQSPGGPVQFHDLVDEEQLAGMYRHSAVQIISEERGASQGSLPSKLSNILWMGVPVFCITDADSELARLVVGSGLGTVDSTFHLASQVRALEDLLDRSGSWDREDGKLAARERLGDRFSFKRILRLLEAAA